MYWTDIISQHMWTIHVLYWTFQWKRAQDMVSYWSNWTTSGHGKTIYSRHKNLKTSSLRQWEEACASCTSWWHRSNGNLQFACIRYVCLVFVILVCIRFICKSTSFFGWWLVLAHVTLVNTLQTQINFLSTGETIYVRHKNLRDIIITTNGRSMCSTHYGVMREWRLTIICSLFRYVIFVNWRHSEDNWLVLSYDADQFFLENLGMNFKESGAVIVSSYFNSSFHNKNTQRPEHVEGLFNV